MLVENGAKCSPCLVGVAANIWGFGPPGTVGILLAAPDIRIGGDSRLLPSALPISLADGTLLQSCSSLQRGRHFAMTARTVKYLRHDPLFGRVIIQRSIDHVPKGEEEGEELFTGQ